MKFIYFTDIHLDSGIDAFRGFELCVESMLEHQPEVLINGGDVGLIARGASAIRPDHGEGICAGAIEPRQPRDVQRLSASGTRGDGARQC